MYSVQQLQALDYLLKRLVNDSSFAIHKKNLKLVIAVNNSLWHGDFIQMDSVYVKQLSIDDSGDIEYDRFSATSSNAITLLKNIWDTFVSKTTSTSHWSNPFRRIDNLPLLFEILLKILNDTDIPDDPSPFHPYLLNAKSLDDNISLPFMNLQGEQIKLISIIEVES